MRGEVGMDGGTPRHAGPLLCVPAWCGRKRYVASKLPCRGWSIAVPTRDPSAATLRSELRMACWIHRNRRESADTAATLVHGATSTNLGCPTEHVPEDGCRGEAIVEGAPEKRETFDFRAL